MALEGIHSTGIGHGFNWLLLARCFSLAKRAITSLETGALAAGTLLILLQYNNPALLVVGGGVIELLSLTAK